MSSSSSDARLRMWNENRETRVDRIVIMRPDGMAVVLEIPQSRSIVHSFEQVQGLCPRNDESAGKRRSTRLRKGAPCLKTLLVQCAQRLDARKTAT